MLKKQIRDEVARATVTLPAKGGRGTLVSGGFIVTAAHCLDCRFDGSMATWGTDPVLAKICTRNADIKVMVYAVEPCSDVAVLGAVDDQDWPEEREAFESFCEQTKPVIISQRDFEIGEKLAVHIYGRENKWATGNAKQISPSPPWTYLETAKNLEGGSSGSPIMNEAGELVGIVSWGGTRPMPDGTFCSTFPRPHLALPVRIWREILADRHARTASRSSMRGRIPPLRLSDS